MPKLALIPLALGLAFLAPLKASEIPADLDAQSAAIPAAGLDAVEQVQLAVADPAQQGGDALTIIVILAAVLAGVYLWFRHEEVMSGNRS